MNVVFPPLLYSLGIIAACLLAPPLIGGLVAGAGRHFAAKKQGRKVPPLLQPFHFDSAFFALLSMTFHLTALILLGMQMNLPPIIFLYAFGALAPIMGEMSSSGPAYGRSANYALKDFLICQSILFLFAIALFFATGSFNFSAGMEHPRLLAIDLPMLFVALMFVVDALRSVEYERALNNPPLAVAKLANCYRSGTLLLLAGSLFANSLTEAVAVAILLYMVLVWISSAPASLSQRLEGWNWGYVLFACGVNLIWIYIKYWI